MSEIIENNNEYSLHECSTKIPTNTKHAIRTTKPKTSKKMCPNSSSLCSNKATYLRAPKVLKGCDPPLGVTGRVSRDEAKINVDPLSDLKNTETDTDTENELASLSIPTPNTLKYLFRSHIPIDYLYNVLEKICVKNEKYYIIDFNSYRLLQFHDLYTDFAERIIQAYKPSKQKYVTRTLTYNSFVTIVRHICRINGIPFDTKFNYQYSLYNIDYYIYFTYHPTPSLFPPMLSR